MKNKPIIDEIDTLLAKHYGLAQGKSSRPTPPWVVVSKMHPALNG